jgi:flagellar basal-body rod modification protein FlgD
MTVSTTTAAAGQTAQAAQASQAEATSKTQLARSKLSETYDNFLKLLTTQLQYQDPMAPMDSAQFTNQLVLYSQVEQQIGQNEKLEKLLTMQNASQTQASLGFIGLDVEVDGDVFDYGGDPVRVSYGLEAQAAKAKIQVLDAKGNVVQEVDAKKTAGSHEFTWDGKTKNGIDAPEGLYRVRVSAFDAAGEPIDTGTTLYGRVTGIEASNGQTTLLMGEVRVKMEQVRSATDPKAKPAEAA